MSALTSVSRSSLMQRTLVSSEKRDLFRINMTGDVADDLGSDISDEKRLKKGKTVSFSTQEDVYEFVPMTDDDIKARHDSVYFEFLYLKSRICDKHVRFDSPCDMLRDSKRLDLDKKDSEVYLTLLARLIRDYKDVCPDAECLKDAFIEKNPQHQLKFIEIWTAFETRISRVASVQDLTLLTDTIV